MEGIPLSLAIALAGQVATGLAAGDEQEDRARNALIAIGLMLRTATNNNEIVVSTLAMAEETRITRLPDGGLRIEPKGRER
jgi:hypothetical protein